MAAANHRQTEDLHSQAIGLDEKSDSDILNTLLDSQLAALQAVRRAHTAIASAAELMANTVRTGGTLHYCAAGSSALMGLADGVELPGTYGIPPDQIAIHMAGGIPQDGRMPGATEDDAGAALQAAQTVAETDTVIAISASGTTPYPMAFADAARKTGAKVVAIANNPDAALFQMADAAILLATPPEVVAGSTRLGAASAQKVALNMMSTLMGIRLGHVHDGMMVNLIADNEKLRGRAVTIVKQITAVDDATAQACLHRTEGAVKPAVLLAAGATSISQANKILEQTSGNLRAALRHL